MAIENFSEITEYIEKNKETDEVKNFVGGLSKVDLDKVKNWIVTDEGKGWYETEKKTHADSVLEGFKKKDLQKIIDEKVAEAKGENLTPDQKRIALLEKEIEEGKKAALTEKLNKVAMDYVLKSNLPLTVETMGLFIGADEKSTLDNLKKFEKDFKDKMETILKEKAKGGYVPPVNKGGETISLGEQMAQARAKKKEENSNNPYSKMWTI